MKRSSGLWLKVTGVGCLVFAAACAQNGPTGSTSGSGGQSSGSGGDNSSSGGNNGSGGDTSSSGGNNASGGNNGSGGIVLTGAGGNNASGGATGAGGAKGGATGSGGTPASGGATGSGGTPASGGATGSGGTPASGGATGSGGAAGATGKGGSTGSGGAAGATGSGGAAGSGAITPMAIVPGLMNLYWEGTCVGTRDPGGHNCPLDDNGSNCPTNSDPTKQGTVRSKTIPVMGTANQAYTVNIEVIGVIGTRCYSGGTRASTASIMTDGYNNSWYSGGSPSNSTDWWNSYEIHVSPSTGASSGDVYYLNAFDNAGGNYCDSEATYMVQYPASFKVLGGGSIKLVLHDYNCQAQQNCGSNTDGTSTCMPRTVSLGTYGTTVTNSFMGGTQKAPTSVNQPPTDTTSKTDYPQWLMIYVTSVTSP